MKNIFSKPSETCDSIYSRIMDNFSNDEHIKVTIEKTKWNSISRRWDTLSIDVKEFVTNSSDSVFVIVTNKYSVF